MKTEEQESRLDRIIKNLEERIQAIDDELGLNQILEELKQEREDAELKQKIIAKILSSKNKNEHLESFRSKISELAETNIAHSASIDKLEKIDEQLEIVCAYPKLYQNAVIAVGGGFSSGKSSFINSFIQDDEFKLAAGINPTTAIPTYILHSDENNIKAFTKNGAYFDLQEIDERAYYKLSHEFLKNLGFNLRDLMPFIVSGVPMKESDLCFIDTPGYNPSSDGYKGGDAQVSKDFLSNASALLWLIGLDSNGTIGQEDLEFLEGLNLENKELYIVLNKADIKPQSSLEDILDVIEDTLEDYDFNLSGICAYSSSQPEEENRQYPFRKQSLFDFLERIKETASHRMQEDLAERLYNVYTECEEELEKEQEKLSQEQERRKIIKNKLHSMELDLVQAGIDDISNELYLRIQNLQIMQKTDVISEKLDEVSAKITKLHEIFLEFDYIIETIFGNKISESNTPNQTHAHTKAEDTDTLGGGGGQISQPLWTQQWEQ